MSSSYKIRKKQCKGDTTTQSEALRSKWRYVFHLRNDTLSHVVHYFTATVNVAWCAVHKLSHAEFRKEKPSGQELGSKTCAVDVIAYEAMKG